MLFEPRKEINLEEALDQIWENMAEKKWLRRWGPVQMNKFGLKRGGSIGMKLYTLEELKQLEAKSRFGEHNSIDKTALLNISIIVCIHLWKPGSVE